MATDQIDTIVGAQVELKGSLRNQGSIQIHGTVIGDVTSDAVVVVGETAIVTGPITANQVEVAGQVHGSITAHERIELHPHSLVKGDLSTKVLSIKPGATFIGKSNMSPEPNMNHEVMVEEDSSDKKKPHLEIEA